MLNLKMTGENIWTGHPLSLSETSMEKEIHQSYKDSQVVHHGGGGGLNYVHAHIHQRFRHAHHDPKDWLPSLGSRGRREERVLLKFLNS